MEYKELIKQLRAYRLMIIDRSMIDDALTNSANAIETLLAERDAVMKDLHGECDKCRYFGLSAHPCCHCYINGGMFDYWQWRGPQKECGT